MTALDPELVDNYRELHESTGEPYASIATRVETGDPSTAAKLREQFGRGRTSAPVDRSAGGPSETTEAPKVKAPRKTAAKKAAPAKKS